MRTEILPLITGNSRPTLSSEVQALIDGFDTLFFGDYNTRLVAGDSEPIYLPSDPSCAYNQVVFANGFFASALHEIAHWCIAGKYRRQQQDYGYWYLPDGRSVEQQTLFEQAEVKPQALEWIFTQVCQRPFYVSADNLNGVAGQQDDFKQNVAQQARLYIIQGLPPRAWQWLAFLQTTYGGRLAIDDFY